MLDTRGAARSTDAGATPPGAETVPELLDDLAASHPDDEALVSGETRLGFADIAEGSRNVARSLAEIGVGPDSVVGLLATNRPEWVIAASAAMRCGARVDALNTWVKAYDLDYLLRFSATEVLIMVARVRSSDLLGELRSLIPEIDSPGPLHSARFPALRHVIVIGDGAGDELPAGALAWDAVVTPRSGPDVVDDRTDRGSAPALVLYTSGSTSNPKAVPLCHRDMIVNGFHIGERMGLTADDRVWLGSPLFWSYGCANALMAAFTHGAALILQEQFGAQAAADVMTAERVSAAYLLPTMIDALAAEVPDRLRALASLRTGLTIGRPDAIDRAADELGVADICNIYGSTETYGNCCVTDHRMPLEQRRVCQGEPLPGVEVRIVDEDGGLVAPGGLGEAQVRGRLTPGYLGDDAANAAAFTADGWFRTGDRMMLTPEGTVAFVDRTNDMIKTSGINVSPAEVENFLATHPGVREVLVVGAPHPSKEQVAVAFVVANDDTLTPESLIGYARTRVAGYKVPWLVTMVDELPRTGTGKVVRRGLADDARALVDAAVTGEASAS